MLKVRRDKRLVERRVRVSNPQSKLNGRVGTIKGFRGDQAKGNPYVMVYIDNHHIETISARYLEFVKEQD